MTHHLAPTVLETLQNVTGTTDDQQAAIAAGLDPAEIARWRTGTTVPDLPTMIRLHSLTQVPLHQMITLHHTEQDAA